MHQDTKIGFIGLGARGFGMAASLSRAGFDVIGVDLRREAVARLVELGGAGAASPEEAARHARLLFVMVVNDGQVEEALFGDHGAAVALPEGATVVLSSTVPAGFVRSLAGRLAERRLLLLDPKVLYQVIRNAAGGSWMFDNRVPHMLDDDYTARSACDIWVKDLGMVLGMAKDLRMPLPMAAAAYQVVMMAAAKGLGPIDDAGFIKIYESFTGKRIAEANNEDDGQ